MSINPQRALIIDLDGTLIECGQYYHECNDRGAQYLAQVTGMPVGKCRELMQITDLAACTLPNAFSADRYPRSFAAAALAACHVAAPTHPELVPYATHMAAMERIGASVFDAPYAEYDGVSAMLEQLRADGWYLIIYTKGDRTVQERKLALHQYTQKVHHCVITLNKTPEILARLVQDLGIDVTQSAYIGDSIKDDIIPAKAVGLKAVRVEPRTEWAYDTGEATADAVIGQFSDLSTVLPSLWHAEATAS